MTNKFLLLLILTTTLLSCSDNDNASLENDVATITEEIIIAKIGKTEIKQNPSTNNYTVYENDELNREIIIEKDKDAKNTEIIEYLDNGVIKIINPENVKDFIELSNITNSNDMTTLDLYTTRGLELKSIEIFDANDEFRSQQRCPYCLIGLAVVEAVIEAFEESDCSVAINACTEAGGLPSTTITEGFFGSSCKVDCKEK